LTSKSNFSNPFTNPLSVKQPVEIIKQLVDFTLLFENTYFSKGFKTKQPWINSMSGLQIQTTQNPHTQATTLDFVQQPEMSICTIVNTTLDFEVLKEKGNFFCLARFTNITQMQFSNSIIWTLSSQHM